MKNVSGLTLVSLFAAAVAMGAAGTDPEPLFRVQRLTDRVVVFTENSPWESNHVVIQTARGLVLVDPGHSPLMGRLIRQAVATELGSDRFAYVVDTHEHWGHTWGNAAFPDAVVIGHELAVAAMQADATNLERRAQATLDRATALATRLTEFDPASEEARTARQERDHFERIARGLAEPGMTVRPPDLSFSDRLRLDLGDVTLELHYFGRGHSPSDTVLLVPEERTLLMGCFFLEQGPLPVFGVQPVLDPDRWLDVLHAVLDGELQVEHVILGQHTVWPRERLAAMRDYIADLWPALKTFDAEGLDFDTTLERLAVPESLDFLRQAEVSEDDLQRFHRAEVLTLWRQLKDSAAVEVERAVAEGGAAAGLARYRQLAARTDNEFFFDENEFNLLGYRLLGQDRVDDAIAVFELNVERFPDSWNVYDSLGEACSVKGDRARAIELYRRSVEINPANTNGVQALQRLGVGDPVPGT